MVRYLSVCSGIEAATQAWHALGWRPVAFSEIEKFPSAVLAHHYPGVPNWGDMTKFEDWPDEPIDLLVGGTPCQSFSVAGLRAGLADPRGNLALTYLAIVAKYCPRWVVWENVPGVYTALSHDAPDPRPPEIDLDSDDGPADGEEVVVEDWYDSDEDHAFACFVAGLQELGYGVAYRTLDAQYVRTRRFPRSVPQRRRRVFVVGYLGDWRPAAAVLFERESLSGHPPPRREAGESAAPTLAARTRGGGGLGTDFDCDGGLIASTGDVSHCLNAGGMGRIDYETKTMVAHALRGEGFDASEDGTGKGIPLSPEVAGTMKAVANSGGWSNSADHAAASYMIKVAPTLRAGGNATGGDRPYGTDVDTCDSLVAEPIVLMERGRGDGPNLETRQDGTANAILTPNGGRGGLGVGAVAFNPKAGGNKTIGKSYLDDGSTYTLDTDCRSVAVQTAWVVRRLTPRECERLQAFPDDFTRIPYRGKPADQCPDGPRYKALGNSMAVNVMDWIGERIAHVESIIAERTKP